MGTQSVVDNGKQLGLWEKPFDKDWLYSELLSRNFDGDPDTWGYWERFEELCADYRDSVDPKKSNQELLAWFIGRRKKVYTGGDFPSHASTVSVNTLRPLSDIRKVKGPTREEIETLRSLYVGNGTALDQLAYSDKFVVMADHVAKLHRSGASRNEVLRMFYIARKGGNLGSCKET